MMIRNGATVRLRERILADHQKSSNLNSINIRKGGYQQQQRSIINYLNSNINYANIRVKEKKTFKSTINYSSSASSKPVCKFITAASYLGKPKSSSKPALKDNEKDVQKSDYEKWVEEKKVEWIKEFSIRQSQIPTDLNLDSLKNSGHDWWFINDNGSQVQKDGGRYQFMGVADGVGGWEDQEIDPAQVSQSLMYHSYKLSNTSSQTNPSLDLDPMNILSRSYDKMVSDPLIRGGSSTALIARFDSFQSRLDWCNLGDSTLWIFKKNKKTKDENETPDLNLSFQTIPQTHYFNCPYQLTKLPSNNNTFSSSAEFNLDLPSQADFGTSSLDDGDLILACTDGLSDNIWPQEVIGLIKALSSNRKKKKSDNDDDKTRSDLDFIYDLAYTISSFARMASFQTRRVTPFEIEARRNSIDDLRGGKVDDITLVISLVKRL